MDRLVSFPRRSPGHVFGSSIHRDMQTLEDSVRPQKLGKYELIASLGQGGMANVYLALVAGPAGFNKLTVLKLLREDVITGMEDGLNMFLDEARLSARLVHQNIVHTYEVGEHEGRYFIAMEYLDGQAYRAISRRARAIGGIPIHEELRIISETANGLHYAHQLRGYNDEPLGVVHRDVSPQNVFVSYDGQVKLLDFGIAKTSEAEHMTQVGVIKGKIDYIAPEQLRGETLDGRADVFALGAMLWEAVSGRRFAGGRKVTDVAKVQARIVGGEPNVRVVQPQVPEELAVIIDRAVALDPSQRWPTAGAFGEAIEHYVATIAQKPSSKTLAAFVMPLFEEERQKMRKLVERQIEAVKQRGPIRLGESGASALPRLRFGEDSNSGVIMSGQESLNITLDGGPRSLAPLTQSSRAAAERRTRLIRRALVVGGAIVVGATVGLISLRGPEATPLAIGPASSSGTAARDGANGVPGAGGLAPVAPSAFGSSQALAPAAALVSLEVKVSPPDARVSLDGAFMSPPYVGQFRNDGALHHLEVSAPGFRSAKQLIAFDRDRVLEIALDKTVRAPAAHHARATDKSVDQASQVASPPPSSPKIEAAERPEPEAEPGYGEDLKTSRPRVTRGRIDAIDPYAEKK